METTLAAANGNIKFQNEALAHELFLSGISCFLCSERKISQVSINAVWKRVIIF
jgi:hypothetical protein